MICNIVLCILNFINNMVLANRINKIVEYSKLSIPKFAEYVGFKTPQTVRGLIKGDFICQYQVYGYILS